MSDKSPLFVSALELLSHATEIFIEEKPKKHKFVILHLANAIELLLKDCVIDSGSSIYVEKKNVTISIWDCFDKLENRGINIPERPKIELLIDDRNTIQHRFGYPSGETVYYYLDLVVTFFQRVLKEQYEIELGETLKAHLSNEQIEFLGLTKDDYRYLDKLFELSQEAAIVKAYSVVEKKVLGLISSNLAPEQQKHLHTHFWHSPEFMDLVSFLENKKFVSQGILNSFSILRNVRNLSAHSDVANLSDNDFQEAYKTARELLTGLDKAQNAGYIPPENATDS